MVAHIDKTFISLVLLTILIICFMSWLVIRTLKEGRKALKELNNNK